MQRVLLNCHAHEDASFIKNYIEAEMPLEVVVAADLDQLEIILKKKPIHLLVMQSGRPTQADINYTLSLRKSGYAHPTLLLTDTLEQVNIEEMSRQHKIYFLERPFELATLKGLTRKLMALRQVPQQFHRRYRTNLAARIEAFSSGEALDTQVFNLSHGGAYFEFAHRPLLKVGDLLRMKVQLEDLGREHQVHGKIVWSTLRGHAAGGYGYGIQFLKSSDVYRSLVSKI